MQALILRCQRTLLHTEPALFEFADTVLRPAVPVISRWRTPLQLAVSPRLAEWLEQNEPALLQQFLDAAKNIHATFLLEPYGDPEVSFLAEGELAAHIAEAERMWKRFGVRLDVGLFLRSTCISSIPEVQKYEAAPYFVTKEDPSAHLSPGVFQLSDVPGVQLLVGSGGTAAPIVIHQLDSPASLVMLNVLSQTAWSKVADLTCEKASPSLSCADFKNTFATSSHLHPAAAEFSRVLSETRSRIVQAPTFISEHENAAINEEHLKKAQRFFYAAQGTGWQHQGALTVDDFAFAFTYGRQEAFHALLSSEVELDTIYHPEVEPIDGWVQVLGDAETGKPIIDTQLLQLRFGNAAVEAFLYKPRKCNLMPASPALQALSGASAYFSHISTETPSTADFFKALDPAPEYSITDSRCIVTRPSGAAGVLRFEQKVFHPKTTTASDISISREFTVHAGLGAQLPNATTGFSMEYGVESETPLHNELVHCIRWNLALPSLSREALSLRPLLCVGGISESSINGTNPVVLLPHHAPGGLYGVRLIDGIDTLIVELRLSQPAMAIVYLPLFEKSSVAGQSDHDYGFSLTFIQNAAAVANPKKSHFLFFSLM